jgi:hypothetical protein
MELILTKRVCSCQCVWNVASPQLSTHNPGLAPQITDASS